MCNLFFSCLLWLPSLYNSNQPSANSAAAPRHHHQKPVSGHMETLREKISKTAFWPYTNIWVFSFEYKTTEITELVAHIDSFMLCLFELLPTNLECWVVYLYFSWMYQGLSSEHSWLESASSGQNRSVDPQWPQHSAEFVAMNWDKLMSSLDCRCHSSASARRKKSLWIPTNVWACIFPSWPQSLCWFLHLSLLGLCPYWLIPPFSSQ